MLQNWFKPVTWNGHILLMHVEIGGETDEQQHGYCDAKFWFVQNWFKPATWNGQILFMQADIGGEIDEQQHG